MLCGGGRQGAGCCQRGTDFPRTGATRCVVNEEPEIYDVERNCNVGEGSMRKLVLNLERCSGTFKQ